jgi:hypothetical protein
VLWVKFHHGLMEIQTGHAIGPQANFVTYDEFHLPLDIFTSRPMQRGCTMTQMSNPLARQTSIASLASCLSPPTRSFSPGQKGSLSRFTAYTQIFPASSPIHL